MPKKSSSKVSATKKVECDAGHEQEKPVTTASKKDEIDEIFSNGKRKNPEKGKVGKSGETNENKNKSKKKKMNKDVKESLVEPDLKHRRRTNDGLAIYSVDELGMNKQDAGGTPLCPFDCSCCF